MSGFEKIQEMKRLRAEAMGRGEFAWDPSKHPRDEHGQWAAGLGLLMRLTPLFTRSSTGVTCTTRREV